MMALCLGACFKEVSQETSPILLMGLLSDTKVPDSQYVHFPEFFGGVFEFMFLK